MTNFERNKDNVKESLGIGRKANAVIIVSFSRHYYDHINIRNVSNCKSDENLDPILKNLEKCILPPFEMPLEKYKEYRPFDMTFHVILPNDSRDDLRPFLLAGLDVVWNDTLYIIPSSRDGRWVDNNDNIISNEV